MLLVLLSSAALLYSMQAHEYRHSFSTWRAKLIAEDVADAFATMNFYGEASAGGVLSLAEKLGGYCIQISYKNEEKSSGCNAMAANSVSAKRTIFDGESFSELSVSVQYG